LCNMEVATVLIWVLRVVLPIILFWIYFKLQLPKEGETVYPGSTKHQHARSKLLDYRKIGFDGGPPPSMDNVRLVNEAQAPSLFATSTRRAGRNKDSNNQDRPPKDKERREPRKADKVAMKDGDRDGKADAVVRESGEERNGSIPEPGSDDKMHMESLLNYIAFNRKEPQRTFLVDETAAPPPPPPPPKKAAVPAGTPAAERAIDASGAAGSSVSPMAMEKANAEAQMVLMGAIKFQRADVVRDLYVQLVESDVEIGEGTFALMIKASTLAKDIKTASDLLAKMEASGHCPDSELLDKVMDLYAASRKKKAATNAESSSTSKAATPLSIGAQMFQPCAETFSIAFNESAILSELGQSDELAKAKLSSYAPVFVPTVVGAALGAPPPPPPPSSENPHMQQQRTALSAGANSFQPKGLVSFDPQNYTWTVADTNGDYETEGKGKTGKGKKGSFQEGKGGKSGHHGGKSGYHNGDYETEGKGGKSGYHGGKRPDSDRDMAKKWQPKEAGASIAMDSPSKVGKWQPKPPVVECIPEVGKWQPKAPVVEGTLAE